jgi:two-component system sporulation sensor kinase B
MTASVLFICFWTIALFISLKEFRSKSDTWAAICLVMYGFGGLASFLSSDFPTLLQNPLPALSLSAAMLWGPYALLIYALYYSEKMPVGKMRRRAVITGSALPIVCIYIFTPIVLRLSELSFSAEARLFWHRTQGYALDPAILAAAMIVTVYLVFAFALLSYNLFRRSTAVWRREAMSEYVFLVTTALAYYIADSLLPCFGYYQFWRINIGVIIAQSIVFLLLLFRRNIFGFFYFTKNATSEQVGKAVVSGLGVLQHALKNNILAIRLALQNVQYDYAQGRTRPEDLKKNVQIAQNSCIHLLSVLERIDQMVNPAGMKPERCSILPIIEDVLLQCRPELTEKNIIIKRNFDDNPQAYCDPVHIREVFLNLINNAMEAVDNVASGEITVSVQTKKHKVMIQIADNGCGMDKKQIKRAGTPLITSKKGGAHYGLGLYYVNKVVTTCDGSFALKKRQTGGVVAQIMLLPG